MPPAKIDTGNITLDETEERYLLSKGTSTAKSYRSNLKRFKHYYPDGMVGLIKAIEQDTRTNLDVPTYERERPGEDIIRGFISWHKEHEYSNKATLQALNTIQNCLKFYGITISLAFIETPANQPMRENKKHEWTLDQIKQFVESAEYLRDKLYICFAFQSGLSISDILSLDYRDIKQELTSGILPLAIESYRVKTGEPIKTFIGADTVKLLKQYLESRANLQPTDPVFTFLGNEKRRATSVSIQKKLREYAAKLDFIMPNELENGYNPARSHSLRSGFRSRLTGKMDDNLIEFFMAHLSAEKRTYVNMPLDELREIYANYEHLLSIETTSKQVRSKSTSLNVTEAAFNDLAQQVSKLAQENAITKAKLENVETLIMDALNNPTAFRETLRRLAK
jgi:integrase